MCHYGLSSVVALRLTHEKPNFENWTKKAIINLVIVACGADGLEARKLAVEILKQYITFATCVGIEPLYPLSRLHYIVNYVNNLDETLIGDDETDNQVLALQWVSELGF